MEAGFIALVVLFAAALSFVLGTKIGEKRAERRYLQDTQYTQGTLSVDCSDPEFEPSMFLGSAVPVKAIISRKYITFDVNVMSEKSQK